MTESPPDPDPTVKPRGLWSVISHSSNSVPADSAPAETELESEPEADSHPEEPASAAPRSLFAIMRQAEIPDPVVPQLRQPVDGGEPKDLAEGDQTEIQAEPTEVPVLLSQVEYVDLALPLLIPSKDFAESSRKSAAKRLRQSSTTLLCGLASVGLSALSMRPEVWMSIPSSAFGFFAIILGYLTLTGGRLRNLSSYTLIASQLGMALGTLGLFLGPLGFASLGRELRESRGDQQTRKHLGIVGEALTRYHDKQGSYPIGGTFVRDASGTIKGQHGWMTFLLPFIGEQPLFSQIDQTKPFDAPENLKAMGREIEAYYATGGDRTKIGQGYAVAHFAGVGGDIDDGTGVSHAGIFARDTAIRRADVTDGLANTMIVGELAGNFAPWGDPENWRMIGRGLNKDVNGFGNSAGNGAMFLMGDGSVKMFSNKTDPRLLRKLSSRDGGEH